MLRRLLGRPVITHEDVYGPVLDLMADWEAQGWPTKTPAMLREEADAWEACGHPDLAQFLRDEAAKEVQ